MSASILSRMTVEEFLAWEERQDTRHEFVGRVVRAMTGGTVRHNLISLNVVMALRARLRGRPCEAFGIDVKVRTPAGNVRYPDALVDCGKPSQTSQEAAEPRVIVEVLSPSTEWFDQTQKLEDYQSIASVAHIAFVAQHRTLARLWSRSGGGWDINELNDIKQSLEFGSLPLSVPLSEIYEGVEFSNSSANDG